MTATITYDSYPTWRAFIFDVRDNIQSDGIVVAKGLPYDPGNDLLPKLSSSLGQASTNDVFSPDSEHAEIHAVEAKGEPVKDSYGFPILSTTSTEFPYHTDDYFEEHPSDIVILQCVRPAEVGGDSLVANLNDILLRLRKETVSTLMQPTFPTHFGFVPILEQNHGHWNIRYNRLEIERSSIRLGLHISRIQSAAMDRLDLAIDAAKKTLRLLHGDCLVINNKTVVHGRTAFSGDSDRLFRRVKVHV